MTIETRVSLEGKHGSLAGYTLGCRCDPCKDAKREYQRGATTRRYRSRKAQAVKHLGGKCSKCGWHGDLRIRDKTKDVSGADIALVLKGSLRTLERELPNWELLCGRCARVKGRAKTSGLSRELASGPE